jgi:hypothetical protein
MALNRRYVSQPLRSLVALGLDVLRQALELLHIKNPRRIVNPSFPACPEAPKRPIELLTAAASRRAFQSASGPAISCAVATMRPPESTKRAMPFILLLVSLPLMRAAWKPPKGEPDPHRSNGPRSGPKIDPVRVSDEVYTL